MIEQLSKLKYNNVPINVEKLLLGFLIIAGYVVLSILLIFLGVPPGNEQLIAQALGILGPIVGVIAAGAWPKNSTSAQMDDTMKTLVDKVPPTTVPGEELNYVPYELRSQSGQEEASATRA